ncbi:hypothetical protein FACS189496_5080 [Bacilli bacterium]|nr:hypothetical protein FACS189496_5080 [Bacilli bacterium]
MELNFNEGYEGITDLNVDDFKITFADGSETSIVISKVEDISVENNGYVYALSISGARNDNAEIKIIIQKAGYYITQYEGTISLSGAVYSSKVNSIISNSNLATSALTLSFDTNNGMRGIDGLDVDSFTITSVDGGEESNVKITGVNSEDLGNTYVLSVGGI